MAGALEKDDSSTSAHTVPQLLGHAFQTFSNHTALICAGEKLSYKGMDTYTSRLACHLVKYGVCCGDVVAVALNRSVNLVLAILAVLKAGAAYVPIDPGLPGRRVAQIMESSEPKFVLVDQETPQSMTTWNKICLSVDELLISHDENEMSTTMKMNSKQFNVESSNLAYIMYTSGSTGTPKGVEMDHGSLYNMLTSLHQTLGYVATDRMLAVTTISFDMSFLELFLPILSGATVVVAQAHEIRNPEIIVALMDQHAITTMSGTPAIWDILLRWGWSGQPRVAKILTAGEPLSRHLADTLLACGEEVWNLYGPTETHVVTAWKVSTNTPILIGKPIVNCHIYVLDADGRVVPEGSHGELYIGGVCVARGYRCMAEATTLRFMDDPFHPGRMYRTGDLARLLPSGEVELGGRMDDQIKVRGYRIEPGDVEAAIVENQLISEAIILSRDDNLVAYCIRDRSTRGLGSDMDIKLHEVLRPWLAARLPHYMVPSFFIDLAEFPLTYNGKIDYRALADLADGAVVQPMNEEVSIMKSSKAAEEREIVAIWSRVLGHSQFSMTDSFFNVDGNSSRVLLLQNQLQSLTGRSVSPAVVYDHYTIKALATYISNIDRPQNISGVESRSNDFGGENIAIVSMACRFPGDVDTPQSFWDYLKHGGNVVAGVPRDRWDAEAVFDQNPDAHGKSYCCRGGFLTSVDLFDAPFFGISPREARSMDPAQALVLETCWEASERGGYTFESLRDSLTGVFIGTSTIPAYGRLDSSLPSLEDLDGYAITGTANATLSGRVSHVLGLRGPAMTIDTACSSSLVATHLACAALRNGECDMALSAGVNLQSLGLYIEFSQLRGMSSDGYCRPFAADTTGTGWSEGAAVVLLKRASDAIRDGDKIYATLLSSAVNHDGRSSSLTAPSTSAQTRLINTALEKARLKPDDIDYVEAHGTGTLLGDCIEATALAEVFRLRSVAKSLWMGSVKSNINHTQAAAGLAGLMKVVLSLQHDAIPPTLYAANPNPNIDWDHSKIALVQELQLWIRDEHRIRRAGVSAFGIGGTNAHIIVEEPPQQSLKAIRPLRQPVSRHPFLLSAHSHTALLQQAKKLHLYLLENEIDGKSMGDVAFTLATCRTHFRRRAVLFAETKAELLQQLSSGSLARHEVLECEMRLTMMFPGQGCQWHGMGQALSDQYPVFRETLLEVAAKFNQLQPPLLDVMWASSGDATAALLHRTDYAQAALFTLEVSLWHLWRSFGVQPDYLMGHSVGELAAAHVAGVMELDDACKLVASRGSLMQALSFNGGMTSFETSPAELVKAISFLDVGKEVEIAAYNAETQTVASGNIRGLKLLEEYLGKRGCTSKRLNVSQAFHSYHMDELLDDLRTVAQSISFSPPKLAIVSSMTGDLAQPHDFTDPDYWTRQARRPVRFSTGVEKLRDLGVNVCVELGPAPVLCTIAARCFNDLGVEDQPSWLCSLRYRHDDPSEIQTSICKLHTLGANLDWATYFEHYGLNRIELPTYPFQRQRYKNVSDSSSSKFMPKKSAKGATTDISQFRFDIKWTTIDKQHVNPRGSWGLICLGHEEPLCNAVQETLSRMNVQVLSISTLVEAIRLDGLVCVWSLDIQSITQMTDYAAQGLAQLQDAIASAFVKPVVWISLNGLSIENTGQQAPPYMGALWGLMRTARTENPDFCLRVIDLDEITDGQTLIAALMHHEEPELIVRRGELLSPRLDWSEPLTGPMASRDLARHHGAVMVTGGFGGIGRNISRWLVRTACIRDLVLLSRHGDSSSGARAFVHELETLGAKVTVVTADVSNFESISGVMSMFGKDRPLRGIMHTAGVIDCAILTNLTTEQVATVFEAKVCGTWYLHQLTQHLDLDFFVMLSSIAGSLGLPGVANYAAANGFLDAMAHFRHTCGLPATSVAFGTWTGEGMAARLDDTTTNYLFQMGLSPLPPEDGLVLLGQAMLSYEPFNLAAALDINKMRQHFEDASEIPAFFRSLLGTNDSRKVKKHSELSQKFTKGSARENARLASQVARQAIRKALGLSDEEDFDMDRPLMDLGIDSLTAIMLRNHLKTLAGIKLAPDILIQHFSPKELSRVVFNLAEQGGRTSAPDERSPTIDDVVYSNGKVESFRRSQSLITAAVQSVGLEWSDVSDITPAYDFAQIASQNGTFETWSFKTSGLARSRNKLELREALSRAITNNPMVASFLIWDKTDSGSDLVLHFTVKNGPRMLDHLLVDCGTVATQSELQKLARSKCEDSPLPYPGPLVKVYIYHVEDMQCAGFIIDHLDYCLSSEKELKPHIAYKVWCDLYYSLRASPAALAACEYNAQKVKDLNRLRDCIWPPLERPRYEGPYYPDGFIYTFSAKSVQQLCSRSSYLTPYIILKAAHIIFLLRATSREVAIFGNLVSARGQMPFLPASVRPSVQVEAESVSGQLLQSVLNVVRVQPNERTSDFLFRQHEEQKLQSRHECAPWFEIMRSLDHESAKLFANIATHTIFNWLGLMCPNNQSYSVLDKLCKVSQRNNVAFENEVVLVSSAKDLQVTLRLQGAVFSLEELRQCACEIEEATTWLTNKTNWVVPIQEILSKPSKIGIQK